MVVVSGFDWEGPLFLSHRRFESGPIAMDVKDRHFCGKDAAEPLYCRARVGGGLRSCAMISLCLGKEFVAPISPHLIVDWSPPVDEVIGVCDCPL